MGVWWLVKEYAKGIGLKNLAPHDLRRTCAKLCRKSGGDLEQIQMLLGHASIQTTEKYLGMQQNLVEAVNDKLGIVDAEGGQCRDRNPLKDASNGSRMLI